MGVCPTPRSLPPDWRRRSGRSKPSAASTSRSPRAPSSGCSGPTARARPRPSASSRRSCAPTPARRRSAARRRRAGARGARPRSASPGQYAAVDENLTGAENLRMVGRLYRMHAPGGAQGRADELLERFELTDAADRPGARPTRAACAAASTSPRRWCAEPAGALPRRAHHRASTRAAALGLWDVIERARRPTAPPCCSPPSTSRRPTGWPTTIAVIDHGRVIAEGTPAELKVARGRRARRDHHRDPRGGARGRPGAAADRRRRGAGRRPRGHGDRARAAAGRARSWTPCACSTPSSVERRRHRAAPADAGRRVPHAHRPRAPRTPTRRRWRRERGPRRACAAAPTGRCRTRGWSRSAT